MDAQQKQEYFESRLSELQVRATEQFEKGHLPQACYLAQICGMYANFYKQSYRNRFEGADMMLLYRFFANGYDDFSAAIQVSNKVRAEMLKKEKQEDKARVAKGKLFGMKIW